MLPRIQECKMVQSLWKTVWQFPKRLHRVTIWSSNSTLNVYASPNWKHMPIQKTCTQMFITALFIIAKKWKQTKCLSTDEWINKMRYIHMEYYSATKRILIHATASMNLKSYAKWKKSDTKGHILYDSIFMNCPE